MTYPVWVSGEWVEVAVPQMSGEPLVVPNVAAVILSETGDELLLQRRDKLGEPVRGKLELPGGRWAAGEPPEVAVAREVAEETGIELLAIGGRTRRLAMGEHRSCGVAHPVAVINGLEGVYPSLHVLFECVGRGQPRSQSGETTDGRWWPVPEVATQLQERPEEFVDQARAMLLVWFEARTSGEPGRR